MRKYFACLIGLVMVLGLVGLSSAAIVTDPAGDQLAGGTNTDITAVRAESTVRGDGNQVIKLSVTATPNIGGIVIFEADVDNSTGTGGSVGMTGMPGTFAPPCRGTCSGACKAVPGIDIAVVIINRGQDENSTSALKDTGTPGLPHARIPGEYYAVAMAAAGADNCGAVRGLLDPSPDSTKTTWDYTIPWGTICAFANAETSEKFGVTECQTPALTQWQVSVWTDPDYALGNEDDIQNDGPPQCFDICDWVPNAGLVNGLDIADKLTYCEGNFTGGGGQTGDSDVDGTDASKFKGDYGRNSGNNPCPRSNQNW